MTTCSYNILHTIRVIYRFGHEQQMLNCYATKSPKTAEPKCLSYSFEQTLFLDTLVCTFIKLPYYVTSSVSELK